MVIVLYVMKKIVDVKKKKKQKKTYAPRSLNILVLAATSPSLMKKARMTRTIVCVSEKMKEGGMVYSLGSSAWSCANEFGSKYWWKVKLEMKEEEKEESDDDMVRTPLIIPNVGVLTLPAGLRSFRLVSPLAFQ